MAAAMASKMAQQLQSAGLASKMAQAAQQVQSGALGSKLAQAAQQVQSGALGSKMAQAAQQLQSGALASKMAEQLQPAALASKMAQVQSKASEATRSAAKQGCAYGKQVQSKACEATRLGAEQGSAYYRTLMERNKQYVVDPPTIEKCQELSKQLFYTRLASLPGRYESFWKEVDGAKLLLKNRKNLKVEDAGVAALFAIELYAWLRVGEIVGRGFTLSGYQV